jgi:preprotein translocase subunit SecE
LVEHWSPKPAVVSSILSSRARKYYILKKLKLYLKEVYVELFEKTSWPTFKELQKESTIVLIASVIFALIVVSMDVVFNKLMDIVYNL